MQRERILILGGTRDARELAAALIAKGCNVITSLAGVTAKPLLPAGEVRTGGFGGSDGLAGFLRQDRISAVVDASHPFAAQMSRQAVQAAAETGVPILRLERPPWKPEAGDSWTAALSASEAAALLSPGSRALVTIGRKEISMFLTRTDVSGLARMIEPYAGPVPPAWTIILERPPFTLEHECELITQHHISHLVTKNAGGADTSAKLGAARALGLPVIMIERPPKPAVPTYANVGELITAHGAMLLP